MPFLLLFCMGHKDWCFYHIEIRHMKTEEMPFPALNQNEGLSGNEGMFLGVYLYVSKEFIFPPLPLVALRVKPLPAMRETWVQALGREDPLEKAMATHSSTLAWRIPWMEQPGRLQPMGSKRVRHD